MSKSTFFKKGSYPSDTTEGGVHELDLTPFMSVFVILIPYLITMVVFTHLAFLKFSLPPNVNAGLGLNQEKPKLKITVVVAPEFFSITYGEKLLDSIAKRNGQYDYALLTEKLTERKKTVDIQNEAVVAVRDKVKFEYVVKVMDMCQNAGFEKIGLSQATENAQEGM